MARLIAFVLALVVCAGAAWSQGIPSATFSTLPGSPTAGQLYFITDGSGTTTVGDAAAGGGASRDLVSYDAGQSRWEFVARIPVTAPVSPLETYLTAERVAYLNAVSGLVGANVQAVIDELSGKVRQNDPVDTDGDGAFESAYLWDADGDGSGFVSCTGNATPDIRCKAIGEVLYPDAADDLNCATIGCGFGVMERAGTIRLRPGVVYVQFPCWKPSGTNTATAHETNDDLHDQTTDAAFTDCPLDPDGKRVKVVALRGWQGTIIGGGADTRELHRGLMSASRRRDVGTYLVNDMGPWDASRNSNVWFGNGDLPRGISTGYANNATDTNHPMGGGAAEGDSKGWWKVFADVNLETFVNQDSMICLQHAGGTAGADYKTASTVTNLAAGDLLLIPIKPTSTSPATTYNLSLMVIRSVPGTTCGTGSNGRYVNVGGSSIDRSNQTASLPTSGAFITAADSVRVIHARADFENTGVEIRNLRIEPQDPWNEVGGRCTNSGAAWRASLAVTGTPFSNATDDTNTSNACDTMPLVGIWGGGWVRLRNLVFANHHKFAIDAGGTGYADIEGVKFLFGQGQEVSDTSNGWRWRNIIVDQGHYIAGIWNNFAPGTQFRDILVRNSVFNSVMTLDHQSPKTVVDGVTIETSAFLTAIRVTCGAIQNTIRNVFGGSRGISTISGNSPSMVYLDCDETARAITQNVFENIVLDAPDVGQGGETAPVILYNVEAASGNSADAQWGAIVGNTFRGVRSTGYVGGTAGEAACLYGVAEADADSPADDDGESVIFTRNYHSGGAVSSTGRVFCMVNKGSSNINATDIDSTGAVTPAWGDPVGCGNLDGGVVYADENCQ